MASTIHEVRPCRCCCDLFDCIRSPYDRGPIYCERCRLLSCWERKHIMREGGRVYRDQRWELKIKDVVRRPLPGHSNLILDDFFLSV